MVDLAVLFVFSTIAGLATGVGGMAAAAFKPSRKIFGFLIGLTAGVMISVSFLTLINTAWSQSGFITVTLGFVSGALVMFALDMTIPHIHFSIKEGAKKIKFYRSGMLIAIGIALHNIPEGIAEGAGYSSLPKLGFLIAIGIALHNIPEGMATALPLIKGGASKSEAIKISFLSGLVEPVGAVAAALFLSGSGAFIPFALAFAAGVMIFITLDELIPMAQCKGHEHYTPLGIITGFAAMFTLIGTFGL